MGGSSTFHDASGAFHGLKGGLHGGGHGRTPQSGPNVWYVTFSVACTVVGEPPSGVSVTRTVAPAIDALKSMKP